MKYFDTLQQAQAAGPFLLIAFDGTKWDAYEPIDALPQQTLAQRQASAWERIKAMRNDLKVEGGYSVTVGGVVKWFHSDTFSRTQQLGLVLLGANVPAGLQWKTMDGSFVTMTQALASAIFQAAAAQDQAMFQAAETHHANMLAAPDPDAYDFSGGWPATFQG